MGHYSHAAGIPQYYIMYRGRVWGRWYFCPPPSDGQTVHFVPDGL